MTADPHGPRILILGYGNPGRQDDGLGPALIDRLETKQLQGAMPAQQVTLQSNYQLTVEDALELKAHDRVVFVDASMNLEQSFHFYPLTVAAPTDAQMGSHTLSPQALLTLCDTLYQHRPEAWMLAIRGHAFDEFEEKLSAAASGNLLEALAFLETWLQGQSCRQAKTFHGTDSRHA